MCPSRDAEEHPPADAQRPWLGLEPFSEANQRFFFGRNQEIRDLFVRIRENCLTVLYGRSGLGKTSVLRAGLFPKLRVEGYRPVHILLDYRAEVGASYVAQAREALASACATETQSAEQLLDRCSSHGSLWEIYADKELRSELELEKNPPVLVFDQFEEVFTLGRAGEQPSQRNSDLAELIDQLGDVIENRTPKGLVERLRADPGQTERFDFRPTAARVVIALRDDYLAQLESFMNLVPSLMRNRMALHELSGPNAREAVFRPGQIADPPIINQEVSERIVRFVAKRSDDTPLEEIEAVPPLVSLMCERLNEARIETGDGEISAASVRDTAADILDSYYERCFESFSPSDRDAIRELIEERFITVGGHRNPVANDDVIAHLKKEGVRDPERLIRRLLSRRLITAEHRGGVQRLELTHDLLAPLVKTSRDQRRLRRDREKAERERERADAERRRVVTQRTALVGIAVILMILVAVTSALWRQTVRQRDEGLSRIYAAKAVDRSSSDPAGGLRLAAAAVDFAPSEEAVEALRQLLVESRERLRLDHNGVKVRDAEFSPDGSLVSTASGSTVRLWHAQTGAEVATLEHGQIDQFSDGALRTQAFVTSVGFSPNGDSLVTTSSHGGAYIWQRDSPDTAREDPSWTMTSRLATIARIVSAAFSPDGRLIAIGDAGGTLQVRDTNTGETLRNFAHTGETGEGEDAWAVTSIVFDGDGKRIFSASGAFVWAWNLDNGSQSAFFEAVGQPGGPWVQYPDEVSSLTLQTVNEATYLAVATFDRVSLLSPERFEADPSLFLPEVIAYASFVEVQAAALSPSIEHIAVGRGDRTVRIVGAIGTRGFAQFDLIGHYDNINSVSYDNTGGFIVTAADDGTARVWESGHEMFSPLQRDIHREKPISQVSFSADGSLMVFASLGWYSTIFDVFAGHDLFRPHETYYDDSDEVIQLWHDGPVMDAVFGRDGNVLLTVSHEARVWEVRTGKQLFETPAQPKGLMIAVRGSPDDDTLIATATRRTVQLWRLTRTETVTTMDPVGNLMEPEGEIQSLTFTSDGRFVAVATTNQLSAWAVANQEPVGAPFEYERISGVYFNGEGTRVAVAADGEASVLDLPRDGASSWDILFKRPADYATLSADGQLVVIMQENKARVWDVDQGDQLGGEVILDGLDETLVVASFSSDNRLVAAGGKDGSVVIWETASGEPVTVFKDGDDEVRGLAFHPGREFLVARRENTAHIYRREKFAPLLELEELAAERFVKQTHASAPSPDL